MSSRGTPGGWGGDSVNGHLQYRYLAYKVEGFVLASLLFCSIIKGDLTISESISSNLSLVQVVLNNMRRTSFIKMEVLYVIDIECFFSWLNKEINKRYNEDDSKSRSLCYWRFLARTVSIIQKHKSSSTMISAGQTSLL